MVQVVEICIKEDKNHGKEDRSILHPRNPVKHIQMTVIMLQT